MNTLKLFIAYLMLVFGLLTPQILNAAPLDQWHFTDSLTNFGINDITYGNGLFVAVSGDVLSTPAVLTSANGAVWTKRDFPAVIFYGVGYGNGIFVAVGEDANLYISKTKIYTSSDGVTWEERYSGSGGGLNAVGYGNGVFVAVGWDSIFTSLDGGMTWNRTAAPGDYRGVAYGNGIFVAVGYGYAYTSPDGINWTMRSTGSPSNPIRLNAVAYGNGIFVGVGGDSSNFTRGRILTSPNGISWKIKSFTGNFDLNGVAYDNDTFVAVGTGGIIYTSTDGVIWVKRNSNTTTDLYSIAYGNYTFVTVGWHGVILQSDPTGPEIISTPNVLSGTISGAEKVTYSYSTGGSSSNLDHPVQYFFDWGDGTDSGWLPVGKTSASKSWSPGGIYDVKVQARCANHNTIISPWSAPLSVTIINNSLSMVSPNGGETLSAGSAQTIHWTYTGNPGSYIKIELLKGGVVSRVIASAVSKGTGGTGSRNWTIPANQTPGTDYRIRVTGTSNGAYIDTSDSDFTIAAPTVTVVSPNGGETFTAGTTQTIRWTYAGNPGAYVKIELLKGGVVNRVIKSFVSKGSGGNGSTSWLIPSTQAPDIDYQIRITSTSNNSYSDTSDSYFIISR